MTSQVIRKFYFQVLKSKENEACYTACWLQEILPKLIILGVQNDNIIFVHVILSKITSPPLSVPVVVHVHSDERVTVER